MEEMICQKMEAIETIYKYVDIGLEVLSMLYYKEDGI